MVITLTYGDGRGQWKPVKKSDGDRTATLQCPTCGQFGGLLDHKIQEGGKVHPSVVCPYNNCNFHDYVKLEGW